METLKGAGEGGDVRKATHFGEFADAVAVRGEKFGGKFHACFEDKLVEGDTGVSLKKFAQIDLGNAAVSGEPGKGKLFKGVGKDAVDELLNSERVVILSSFVFSSKTEIDDLLYLNDSARVVKTGGVEIV